MFSRNDPANENYVQNCMGESCVKVDGKEWMYGKVRREESESWSNVVGLIEEGGSLAAYSIPVCVIVNKDLYNPQKGLVMNGHRYCDTLNSYGYSYNQGPVTYDIVSPRTVAEPCVVMPINFLGYPTPISFNALGNYNRLQQKTQKK